MKDPAFLFYSSDFLSGTLTMTDEETGQYIKALCLQHQKGHLTEKDMIFICKSYDSIVFSKFIKDSHGNFYNERLEQEVNRRKKYSESRSINKSGKYKKDKKNISKSYDNHMGTETITETNTEIIYNFSDSENDKFLKSILEYYEVDPIDKIVICEVAKYTNSIKPKEIILYLRKFEKFKQYHSLDNNAKFRPMLPAFLENKWYLSDWSFQIRNHKPKDDHKISINTHE